LEALRALLAERAGEAGNVIEGTAQPMALPAPEAQFRAYSRAQAQAELRTIRASPDQAVGDQADGFSSKIAARSGRCNAPPARTAEPHISAPSAMLTMARG
jgi:hypothetical protein